MLGHPAAARDVLALGAAASMSRSSDRAMLALLVPGAEAAVRRSASLATQQQLETSRPLAPLLPLHEQKVRSRDPRRR